MNTYSLNTITVQRPWAPLIVGNYKRLENRSFCPSTPRAAILIHCGENEPDPATNEIALGKMLACGFTARHMLNNARFGNPGHIIGVARLAALHSFDSEGKHKQEQRIYGPKRTPLELQSLFTWRNKDYRRGWEFEKAIAFADPIPVKGKQGIFPWTCDFDDATREKLAAWIENKACLYTPHQIANKHGERLVGWWWYSDGGAADFIAENFRPEEMERNDYRPVPDESAEPSDCVVFCQRSQAMLNIPLTDMGAAAELHGWLNCGISLGEPFASTMKLCRLMEDDLDAPPGSDRDWLQSLKILVRYQFAARLAMKEAQA